MGIVRLRQYVSDEVKAKLAIIASYPNVAYIPVVHKAKKAARISAHARRKAREQAQGHGWSIEAWQALKSQGCAKCGSHNRIVPDHIVPLCKGGAHDISNIQPLCWWCNRSKGIRVIRYSRLEKV
jgi:5-methylcytosine-specific restriction endonuclease McrA